MSNDFFVKVRRTIGFDGLISTIVGALIVFLPGRSARAAAGMVGAVFIAVGLFRLLSVFQKSIDNNWTRIGHVILSIIYLVAHGYERSSNFAHSSCRNLNRHDMVN